LAWIQEQLADLQWGAAIREIKSAELQQAITNILDGTPWSKEAA
jgi:hypothetical protein